MRVWGATICLWQRSDLSCMQYRSLAVILAFHRIGLNLRMSKLENARGTERALCDGSARFPGFFVLWLPASIVSVVSSGSNTALGNLSGHSGRSHERVVWRAGGFSFMERSATNFTFVSSSSVHSEVFQTGLDARFWGLFFSR